LWVFCEISAVDNLKHVQGISFFVYIFIIAEKVRK